MKRRYQAAHSRSCYGCKKSNDINQFKEVAHQQTIEQLTSLKSVKAFSCNVRETDHGRGRTPAQAANKWRPRTNKSQQSSWDDDGQLTPVRSELIDHRRVDSTHIASARSTRSTVRRPPWFRRSSTRARHPLLFRLVFQAACHKPGPGAAAHERSQNITVNYIETASAPDTTPGLATDVARHGLWPSWGS